MGDFATGDFLSGGLVSLAAVAAVFVATWLVALHQRRVVVVDVTWGLGFVVAAAASFAWSVGSGADDVRRWLVLLLTTVWGVRLAAHIGARSRGKDEDPRYEALLSRAHGNRMRYALVHVFLLQAAIAWFVSLPVQAAMYERSETGWLTWVGAAVWGLGFAFEALADAQLRRFRRTPGTKGKVLDTGLWRYTRHPNYFGDACVWAGLWLVAAQQWPGAATVLSPVAMWYFLAFKTGKPLLEQMMQRSKPGYADYMRRTSGFFPLPPRP